MPVRTILKAIRIEIENRWPREKRPKAVFPYSVENGARIATLLRDFGPMEVSTFHNKRMEDKKTTSY